MTRAVKVLLVASLAFVVAIAGGFVWYVRAGAKVLTVVRTANASYQWTPDQPLWVLLLGDDKRGSDGCGCSDAIHLVGIPAGGGRATFLNIPRDLWVSQPGGSNRINVALQRGGPRRAAEVVGSVVGITIPYVVVTSFGGLMGMIDELGGVTVDIGPKPLVDKNVGLDLPPGPVHMDGGTALAYARSRKAYPDGDLTRTMVQAHLIIQTLGNLRGRGTSPVDTFRYLTILLRHTKTDGLGTGELLRLGRLALSVDPGAIRSVGVPVYPTTVGKASVLKLTSKAAGLFADLRDDAILQNH